ncbi:EG45-like domain containing protein isoform X2 [Phoenix dactylifera]|uniref:EG45-like domain containing protein isoform X2 n=1 Tax=Phoenix dactylifera TaxID=42345 RepID=A0A8B7CCM9_PHODC|nr:EG45-like domain containing protein isoform X2 [Phoenix dactylifera]
MSYLASFTSESSAPFTSPMGKPLPLGLGHLLPWLLSFLLLPSPSLADVGTASFYGPPYLPTACYGSDEGQFPADNLYAGAGEGIWDNGASCGRVYLVRCLSSATPDACVEGQTIQVVILDRAATLNSIPSTNGTTMVLSSPAFGMITQQSVGVINIEFTPI